MLGKRMALAFVTAVFLLAASSAAQADGWRPYKDRPLRVVTQNLYVGGDIFLPISVPSDQFEEAAAEVVNQILTTNFPERAIESSDLIRRQWPHLVGLQEVYHVKICADEAQTECWIDQDYLQILLENLNQYWDVYRVAASVTNTQLVNIPATFPDGTEVFVTIIDRDVTLAHRFVRTRNPVGANFLTGLPIENDNFPGGWLVVLRGYNIVDARVWGTDYKFVNTHIEVTGAGSPFEPFFRTVQMAQTIEFVGLLAAEERTQIVVGDFNSDPFDGPFVPCMLPDGPDDFVPGWCMTPYTVMTGVNPFGVGFEDVWLERLGPFELGHTCCQAVLLDNPISQLYERIDQVWARRSPHLVSTEFLRFVRVDLIGEDPADKTPSGRWPSDHAGVSAKMIVRAPR